jgi:ribosomal-protein-alanine N-acetyltransferase
MTASTQIQVKLRQWHPSDTEALAAIANNINIWNNVRDRLPHPYSIKDAKEWIRSNLTIDPPVNFCLESNGQVAGSIGFLLKEDIYRNTAEIGYFIGELYWGKGIATRGVELLVDHIFHYYPHVVRIYAEVFANNKPSMRVLEKNGFSLESIRKKAVVKNGVIMDDYVWVKFRNEE